MSSRSTSSKGAVRLTAKQKPRIFRHYKKLSLGMLAMSGGILITTQSNGTTDAGVPAVQILSTQSQPTFHFNDHDNGSPDQQQRIVRRPIEKTGHSTTVRAIASNPAIYETEIQETEIQETEIDSAARNTAHGSAVEVIATRSTAQETEIEWNTEPEFVLAMNTQVDSAALAQPNYEPDYKEQPQDSQAGLTGLNVNNTSVNNPFVEGDTTPKTTPVSPLINDPSIAGISEKAEFPAGATKESVTVEAGDSLSKLLYDRGVKLEQMPQLLTDDVVRNHLSNLDIGQTFQVVRRANGEFHSLSAKVGNDRQISIKRSDSGFAISSIDLPMEKERVVTSGTIEQSLYVAADMANLKQSTIMELSDVFQWELDFARDIRKGDHFSLIYDRLYRDGKYVGDGDILAAEFVRGGKHYQAIRYTDPEGNTGYYSPDGRSKRRTFLRHPVDVVRITSKFDPKRVHPVLHQIRAHKGVDYGSPTGTPIRATADGIVRFSGSKSAYGNTIILSHGTDIRTLYAHMSRISDKISNGKRVKQGDVIGYVGATGRVTGAHLHYEFQMNGNHVDPLKVELPAAQPLKAELRGSLRDLSEELLAQMRSVVPDASAPVVTVAAKQQ